MQNFKLIPTSKGGHYLFFEEHLYYKIKPKNPVTGITSWRCRRYHDEKVKCKALLKSSDDSVISLSNQHEDHEKVKDVEALMLVAKQEVKNNVSSKRGPVKQIFDEIICKNIEQNNLELREVSNFVPKFKSIEKKLYKIKRINEVNRKELPKKLQDKFYKDKVKF